MDTLLFWIFALVGVFAGVMVVWHKNPMSSAIYLVVTMLCLAGLYVLLSGPFVAVIQVLVYAGAVMVLILFIIMMLSVPQDTGQREDARADHVADHERGGHPEAHRPLQSRLCHLRTAHVGWGCDSHDFSFLNRAPRWG